MDEQETRPEAVFQKGLQVFLQISRGHATVEALQRATGYPGSTIVRVAALLAREDDIVVATFADGKLHLRVKNRHHSAPLN